MRRTRVVDLCAVARYCSTAEGEREPMKVSSKFDGCTACDQPFTTCGAGDTIADAVAHSVAATAPVAICWMHRGE